MSKISWALICQFTPFHNQFYVSGGYFCFARFGQTDADRRALGQKHCRRLRRHPNLFSLPSNNQASAIESSASLLLDHPSFSRQKWPFKAAAPSPPSPILSYPRPPLPSSRSTQLSPLQSVDAVRPSRPSTIKSLLQFSFFSWPRQGRHSPSRSHWLPRPPAHSVLSSQCRSIVATRSRFPIRSPLSASHLLLPSLPSLSCVASVAVSRLPGIHRRLFCLPSVHLPPSLVPLHYSRVFVQWISDTPQPPNSVAHLARGGLE